MNKNIHYLKNATDGEFYPYAHIDGIVNDDGEAVELATTDDVKVNTDAIAEINNEETGILKQAKDYADELASKNTVVETTITSDLWTGDATPYTATLAVEGVTTETNIDITYNAETITEEQYNALSDARIIKATRSDGAIVFTAYGSVPTVDIPVIVIVGGV